jgi:membrane-bound inhibitor of C-type lysozyme
MRPLLALLAAPLMIAGCATQTPEPEPVRAYTFTCGKGAPTGTIAFSSEEPESATLTMSGQTYILPEAPSASGARYENLETGHSAWNKGNEIMLFLPSGQSYTCSLGV